MGKDVPAAVCRSAASMLLLQAGHKMMNLFLHLLALNHPQPVPADVAAAGGRANRAQQQLQQQTALPHLVSSLHLERLAPAGAAVKAVIQLPLLPHLQQDQRRSR